MTQRMRRCWSYTAGEAPYTVQVHERTPGGVLYERLWDPQGTRLRGGKRIAGAQLRQSLGHRDRERAIAHAQDEARKLRAGVEAAFTEPTLAGVLAHYLVHQSRKKSATSQAADARHAALWRALYAGRKVSTLGQPEWDAVIARRMSGEIGPRGLLLPVKERRPVGPRGVDADLVFINAVFNWALGFRVNGHALLDRNPFGAPAPGVKRALQRPINRAPRLPVATFDRYEQLRAITDQVQMESRKGLPGAQLVERGTATFRHGEGLVRIWVQRSYLSEILEVLEATGRRITAVLRLWHSDLIWSAEPGRRRITAIRWRPFKQEHETVIPLPRALATTLERYVRERPGFGDTPLFPSVRRRGVSISRRTATEWLMEAERLAKLDHLEGGAFHPFRRKWATERKHHPIADVMRAGNWRDRRSLEGSYIHADDETVLAVVNEPKKLRARVLG